MDLQVRAGVKHQRVQLATLVSRRPMAEELPDAAEQRGELTLTDPMTEKNHIS